MRWATPEPRLPNPIEPSLIMLRLLEKQDAHHTEMPAAIKRRSHRHGPAIDPVG
jgi:hypothetical protein